MCCSRFKPASVEEVFCEEGFSVVGFEGCVCCDGAGAGAGERLELLKEFLGRGVLKGFAKESLVFLFFSFF